MKTALVLSLSILIFVLCAGVVIVKISQHIHEDAEKSLKREEVIAAARNKQILGGIEIIENFEKQRKAEQDARNFKRFLNGAE